MAEYAGNTIAQSQAGQCGPSNKKETVNGIAVDLDRNVERLSKVYEALRHVGDRIDGIRPQPIGPQDPPDQPPSSMILDMRRKQSAMSSLLGKCEEEIQRLAQALGIS